ncbi:hypothetical protein J2S00_000179 [Caldalkalibacillus uzonensis]|uniref:Cytosolic protein n=1 Tax=Caldalkalibacillus uzonensis TaxID=353224 RepID=A0ABU0CLX6_9BACI|nr:DUF6282 family protein [Caldalkalibacillus uzonensis]MDQ0337409.1 hypothetical protein [Caldalkalibacillus uzonensis]
MSIYHPLLEGAIELHCHADPSLFPRRQTDWELIEDIKQANMAGVVIKSHESQTVDRASLIRMKEPGLHVYGGLVLNYFTGGLSPTAVDCAIRLGAKMIWMPTFSAAQHQCHFAKKKTRFFNSDKPLVHPQEGIRIWDENRKLLPEVHEILSLIADAGIILATGHLSAEEVHALVGAAKEHKVEKILIQHADLGIAPIPLEQQITLAKQGAIIEKCYLAVSEDFNDLTIEQMAASIRRLGPSACVLVTDYGQVHNVPVVEGLSQFVEKLLKAGIKENDIETMIVHNPRRLLGIEDAFPGE